MAYLETQPASLRCPVGFWRQSVCQKRMSWPCGKAIWRIFQRDVPLLDFDDFYPWGKMIYPFYPTYEKFTSPYFAIRQIDKLAPCFYAESAIK